MIFWALRVSHSRRVDEISIQSYLTNRHLCLPAVHKLSGLRHQPGSQHGNASQYAPTLSSRKPSLTSTTTGYSPPRNMTRMSDLNNGVFSFQVRAGLDFSGLGRPSVTAPLGLFKNSASSWPRGPSGGGRGPSSPTSSMTDSKGAPSRGLVLSKAIEKAKQALQAPRPPLPDVPAFDRLSVKDKQTDDEIVRKIKQMKKKKVRLKLPKLTTAVIALASDSLF